MVLSTGFVKSDRLEVAKDLAALRAARAAGAQILAGGTWLMRAPVRGEALKGDFVALSRVEALTQVSREAGCLLIGAAVTHEGIVASCGAEPGLRGLAMAAGKAANPGVRRVATLGGNLCAVDFAAADLPPALLALEAEVQLETGSGPLSLGIAEFMTRRRSLLPGAILTAVSVPVTARLAGHARLPMRKAGDYPAAILSLSLGEGGARVAVGSVEADARRWPEMEAALDGLANVTPEAGAALARDCLAGFSPRDGVDAPGWYRVEVLPALLRRALTQAQGGKS